MDYSSKGGSWRRVWWALHQSCCAGGSALQDGQGRMQDSHHTQAQSWFWDAGQKGCFQNALYALSTSPQLLFLQSIFKCSPPLHRPVILFDHREGLSVFFPDASRKELFYPYFGFHISEAELKASTKGHLNLYIQAHLPAINQKHSTLLGVRHILMPTWKVYVRAFVLPFHQPV